MPLTKAEFRDRFFARLYDSAFDEVAPALDQVFEKARDGHHVYRKSPRTLIYPCKACVSTAQPLCHWPCSCYASHALSQAGDWINEIDPRWSAAHGVFLTCPVHWYQAPASLTLMIDRLVCADGGNSDPTTTGGKNPLRAKEPELQGWDLRRMRVDWLTDTGIVQAGPAASLDTWIGWYRPYATSHDDLDDEAALFTRVGRAALSLAAMVAQLRSGSHRAPNAGLHNPREK